MLAATAALTAADIEADFTSLFDGKSYNGWKMAEENQNNWTIEDGALVSHGKRCHLFYVGDTTPFKNFTIRVDVMTEPGANGGIYFHTKYQASGWPRGGFECQVNNTHSDWIKTGSLYGVVNIAPKPGAGQQMVDPGNHRARQQGHRHHRRQKSIRIQRTTGGPTWQRLRAETRRRDRAIPAQSCVTRTSV